MRQARAFSHARRLRRAPPGAMPPLQCAHDGAHAPDPAGVCARRPIRRRHRQECAGAGRPRMRRRAAGWQCAQRDRRCRGRGARAGRAAHARDDRRRGRAARGRNRRGTPPADGCRTRRWDQAERGIARIPARHAVDRRDGGQAAGAASRDRRAREGGRRHRAGRRRRDRRRRRRHRPVGRRRPPGLAMVGGRRRRAAADDRRAGVARLRPGRRAKRLRARCRDGGWASAPCCC